MAFKEVVIEEQSSGSKAPFFKFNAIGDRLLGVFLNEQPGSGQYGEGKTWYVFKTKEGNVTLDAPANCAQALRKAKNEGLLQPGRKVMITYTADKDIGKSNPMKLFKVLVDDGEPADISF